MQSISNHRIEWVKESLFPELQLTPRAANRLHSFAYSAVAAHYPHKTMPNTIMAPWDIRLLACCNDRPRTKKLTELMFHKVSEGNSEKHIAAAYRLTDEFETNRYLNSVLNYEPTLSELISIDSPQATVTHPFQTMVPVDVQHMRECRKVLNRYIRYYKGQTKNKPKQLRVEADSIYKTEKRKMWAGMLTEGSDEWKLCSEKRSPKQRTVTKLGMRYDYLGNLLDIAINNGGHIPMSYRNGKRSPRFYATTAFNLQSCPKLVRSSSLAGCVEYDITSCNQTILLDYARCNNLGQLALHMLVTEKASTISTLASDTGISIGNLKSILLAICNAAKLVNPKIATGILDKKLHQHKTVEECHLVHDIAKIVWRGCNNNRNTFADRYTALSESVLVQEYVAEINEIAEHMLENIPAFLDRGNGKLSSALANYTQSIEVKALCEMYKAFPTAMVPIHDAVICAEPGDIELAQYRMEAMTGIKFRLKETRL